MTRHHYHVLYLRQAKEKKAQHLETGKTDAMAYSMENTYVFAPIIAKWPFGKYVISRRKGYTKYHK